MLREGIFDFLRAVWLSLIYRMGITMTFKAIVAAASMTIAAATTASAAVVVDAMDVGSDLVFSYSGTLDLTGNTGEDLRSGDFENLFYRAPEDSFLYSIEGNYSAWAIAVGDVGFAFGSVAGFGEAVGDAFGWDNLFNEIYTPRDYTGGLISGSLTIANESIASLGLIEGSFSISLPNDQITLNIGNVTAVPLPATAPLVLFAFGALSLIRRRKHG